MWPLLRAGFGIRSWKHSCGSQGAGGMDLLPPHNWLSFHSYFPSCYFPPGLSGSPTNDQILIDIIPCAVCVCGGAWGRVQGTKLKMIKKLITWVLETPSCHLEHELCLIMTGMWYPQIMWQTKHFTIALQYCKKRTGFRVNQSGFEYYLGHFPEIWLWATYLSQPLSLCSIYWANNIH